MWLYKADEARFWKNLLKNKNTNILIRITQAPKNITGSLHQKNIDLNLFEILLNSSRKIRGFGWIPQIFLIVSKYDRELNIQ